MQNAIRVEVRRNKNESAASLIRRFSRRAQGLNLVRGMRARRYFSRTKSKNVGHARALVRSERINEYNQLVKLGKIDPAGQKPRLPFGKIADSVLPAWDISLVIAGEDRARNLNHALRNKEYVPNVLSYKVGKASGEIILCPSIARKEASQYGHTYTEHLLFLFIHGLLHLKGLRHGDTMEKQERKYLRNALPLKSNGTTHSNRDRYRNAPNEGRRR